MKKTKDKGKNSGFTLLELLVAMAIMAVLGGLLAPRLSGYINKAREAKYKNEAQAVCSAVSLYLLDLEEQGISPESWELAMDICVPFKENKNHPLLSYLDGAPSKDGCLYSIFYNGTLESYAGVLYGVGGYSIEVRTNGTVEFVKE